MAEKRPTTKSTQTMGKGRGPTSMRPAATAARARSAGAAPDVARTTTSKPAAKSSPVKASSGGSGSKVDQARAAAGTAAAKTKEVAGKAARKAGDAVAGKGKMIAATAGVVAATAAGVAAVKAIKGRKASRNGRVYHVQPRGEDWQVTIEGNERPSGTYGTKKQAISAGRSMAQKHEPSRLIIHGGDGTIQRTHSYGEG